MNSPYTKHLEVRDTPQMAVPTYAAAPAPAPAPVIVNSDSGGGGGKAGLALLAILLCILGIAVGWAFGKINGPSWNELRRYEALAGREGEVKGRDAGWNQGRKQGRTEMQFLAQYEKLRTQAGAFSQGYMQGRNVGQTMGRDRYYYRSGYGGYGYGRGYGYSRYGRGYGYGGYGYGGSVGRAVGNAQALANATGQPVDIVVG